MNRLPSEGKKVLVYTSDRAEPFVGEYLGGMWLIEGRDSCSGVIGWDDLPSSEAERFFTEGEVKRILDDAEALARTMGSLLLDSHEARAMAASDIATIKVRHGINLEHA